MCDEDDVVVSGSEFNADEFVFLFENDRDNTGFAVVTEIVECGFLDLASMSRKEHETSVLAERVIVSIFINRALKAEHCGDFFIWLQVQHVADVATH